MGKVLVTGGAGFMGSHVAERLRGAHEVVALDNLSGGYEENMPDGVELVVGDVSDVALVDGLFESRGFDHVFHLAAYAAEGLSHFIRRFNYQNNVMGSVNLINASIRFGVKKFVFTSSMGVYGTNQVPFDEGMKPAPEDPYGIAKYSIEQDLECAKRMFGMEYVIFRPHNVYGRRQNIWDRYRNVVGIFMNQALSGEPMTVFGDGDQTRAFSHIDDIAVPICGVVDSPSLDGEVVNVGGEQPVTINELSALVAEVLGVERRVVHLPPRYEVRQAYSQHGKLQRLTGIRPRVGFREGLEDMAAWARREYRKRGPREAFEYEQTKNLPSKWCVR